MPKRTVEELELKVEIDRTELDAVMADLNHAAEVKFQLESDAIAKITEQLISTEKAYDRALQENVDLHDRLKRLSLAAGYRMGPTAMQRIIQGLNAEQPTKIEVSGEVQMTAAEDAAAGEPVHVHLSGNEEVVSRSVGALSHTTIRPRPEMSGENALGTWPTAQESADRIIINDPLGPNSDQKEVRDWYANAGLEVIEERPPLAVPEYGTRSQPQVIDGLWHANHRLRDATARAQGDRAKMKGSLIQSQNANRKYKVRLSRQKEQLEALHELSNAAFPLYLALSDALGGEILDGAQAEFMVVKRPKSVQQLCVDFHNRFNDVAELLTKS